MATISLSGWARNALVSATEMPPHPMSPMPTRSLGKESRLAAVTADADNEACRNVRRVVFMDSLIE
jgi:hypothetical protein